ncbi:MAG: lipocalin family protein [Armatimonadota bacterium]
MSNKRNTALLAALGVIVGGGAVTLAVLAQRRRARRILEGAPAVAPQVDLTRYAGLWYEIARYPTWFEPDDCFNTTATYSLRDDGTVEVLNQCRRGGPEGTPDYARGIARVVDPRTNAKLKVTFFWPFAGDYWIIDLGENYEYAVVSDPRRKYLWILSRTPELPQETYDAILDRLRAQGFDTDELVERRG